MDDELKKMLNRVTPRNDDTSFKALVKNEDRENARRAVSWTIEKLQRNEVSYRILVQAIFDGMMAISPVDDDASNAEIYECYMHMEDVIERATRMRDLMSDRLDAA